MSSSDRGTNEASLNKRNKYYTAIFRQSVGKIQISKVSCRRTLGMKTSLL